MTNPSIVGKSVGGHISPESFIFRIISLYSSSFTVLLMSSSTDAFLRWVYLVDFTKFSSGASRLNTLRDSFISSLSAASPSPFSSNLLYRKDFVIRKRFTHRKIFMPRNGFITRKRFMALQYDPAAIRRYILKCLHWSLLYTTWSYDSDHFNHMIYTLFFWSISKFWSKPCCHFDSELGFSFMNSAK